MAAKRVIVTGAAGGIGAATVAELRRRGCEVAGLDLNADDDGIIACDVRDQSSVDAAVAEAIEVLGGLNVLINNAGIGPVHSAGARPDASADAVIDVNLMGPWRVTGAAMPALLESNGRVVNVASGLAHMAVPLAAGYCMAKRGLVAYSDSLRHEFEDRITVTTVYPGYIRTPIHEAAAQQGISLEGLVPAEPVSAAARTLVRAALGPAKRDLATTRMGTTGYFFLRRLPRRWVDAGIGRRFRQAYPDLPTLT
jgi:NAD(P)-dependent dehydrogenase (short-subunit alcohol dehydrogenase family)